MAIVRNTGVAEITGNPNSISELNSVNTIQVLAIDELGRVWKRDLSSPTKVWVVIDTSITEVNTSRELNNTDNNSILIVTASSTLTIPTGLVNGFNCAIYTKTGILTNDTVAGITEFPITAGSTLQENRSQVIMQDPTDPTNYIITGDNE